MSIEANKALVRRHYREVLNQRNAAVIDELYDPAFVTHLSDGSTLGLDRFKQAAAMTHNAFPDLLVVVEDQIAAGDKVVTRSTAR
jgi:predicted ester cyclase